MIVAVIGGAIAPVAAMEAVRYGDFSVVLDDRLTVGTALRTSERNPKNLTPANAAVIGRSGTAVGGGNSSSGELNYGPGDVGSSVVKNLLSLKVNHQDGYGALVQVLGWYDYTQGTQGVPFGNIPNGFAAGRPLSDKGFADSAKFSNLMLKEAYVIGTTQIGDGDFTAKVGQQSLRWGPSFLIAGGLSDLDPKDFAAQARPGSQPDEVLVPFPAAVAKWNITPKFSAQAFVQFEWKPDVLVPCGTYTATSDYSPQGCNHVSYASAYSNGAAMARGLVLGRQDKTPGDGGQFGFGGNLRIDPISTNLGGYFAHYNSRRGYTSATRGATIGPSGRYGLDYPSGISLLALTSETDLAPYNLKITADLTHSFNQPIGYSTTDGLAALLAGAGPVGPVYQALAVGDSPPVRRFKLDQIDVGVRQGLGPLIGAGSSQIDLQLGVKHVEHLPSPAIVRFGRSDLFGIGPGFGLNCANAIACSTAGFVTPWAWGYRLQASITYLNLLPDLVVKPSLQFGQDVRGWAYDGAFNQGRMPVTLAIDVEYGPRTFGRLSWSATPFGTYNAFEDRAFVMVSLGRRF